MSSSTRRRTAAAPGGEPLPPPAEYDWRGGRRVSRLHWLWLLGLAAVVAAIGLHWGPPAEGGADGQAGADTPIMKTALRNLVPAQDAFVADSGHYATRTRQLGVAFDPQVTITMGVADSAWYATAHHTGFDGMCRVWVGRRPARWPAVEGEASGEPTCR